MTKAATKKTAWGVEVENGLVRCLIKLAFGRCRVGDRQGFTVPEIEAEFRKPAHLRRFLPDSGDHGETESLMGVSGMTLDDQQVLHALGVLVPASLLVLEDQTSTVRAGVEAFCRGEPTEEARRRKMLRQFQERVTEVGLEKAQETEKEDSAKAGNGRKAATSKAAAKKSNGRKTAAPK